MSQADHAQNNREKLLWDSECSFPFHRQKKISLSSDLLVVLYDLIQYAQLFLQRVCLSRPLPPENHRCGVTHRGTRERPTPDASFPLEASDVASVHPHVN